MSAPFEELVNGLVRIIITGICCVAFITVLMYWIVWNNAKLSLGKAMDEIEDRIDKVGYIERSYADRMMNTYCDSEAFESYTYTVVEPAFDSKPQYLGQPMYIEVQLNCRVVGIDFKVKGKADAYNRGRYGKGYNTPNQH